MTRETGESGLDLIAARQLRLWEARRLAQMQRELEEKKEGEVVNPYVTISREVGSGGRSIGKRVAERLGWEFFDRELVEHMASAAHVRKSVIESLDEKTMDGIREWISTLIDRDSLSHDHYLKHLMTVLMTIAGHGRAVIVGRGANFVLPPERGLRVRIVAPLEKRIEAIAGMEGLDHVEARRKVIDRDRQMAEFIRLHYNKNLADPVHYDMVLNADSLGIDCCVDIIVMTVNMRLKNLA